MNTYKYIAWSYPTSVNATKAGFAKTGCFSVEIRTGANAPRQIRGFATQMEAQAFYDTLNHEPCPIHEAAKLLPA